MTHAHQNTAIRNILKTGICPIINDLEILKIVHANLSQVGEALSENGIEVLEITERKPHTLGLIQGVIMGLDGFGIEIGVGSVESIPQAENVRRAGAHFVVGPNFDPAVSFYCQAYPGFDYIPGVGTVTEMTDAYRAGWKTVKFFPARDPGGFAQIRGSLRYRHPDLHVIASGMEKPKTKPELYDVLKQWYGGADAIVYESNIFNKEILSRGNWKEFHRHVKDFVDMVSDLRSRRRR